MKHFHRWFLFLPVLALLTSCITKTPEHAPKPQTAEAQAMELLSGAGRYLAELAGQGLLPGHRTGDQGYLSPSPEGLYDEHGQVWKPQITFPLTVTVYAYQSNILTSVTNAYCVTKDSQKADWRLTGSWRWENEKFLELEPAGSEGAVQEDEPFLIEARINGKPAHFAIDTGTTGPTLFSQTATRLGLSVTNAQSDPHLGAGGVRAGKSEECDLTILDKKLRIGFTVIDFPETKTDFDGIVGWTQLHGIFRIDACRGTVTWLDSVPRDASSWTKFRIPTNSEVLRLQIPGGKGDSSYIFIDTGDWQGVALAPELWRTWKAAYRHQPTTLDGYYAPGVGMAVAEEAWADKLQAGPLQLTGVPVREARKDQATLGSIVLGRAALKRLDVIIDRERGIAYLHARQTPPPAYSHNRGGAIFVPVESNSDELTAHVVKGSPAWEAGVRDGDVLLRAGDIDATKWRTADVMPDKALREAPAGTVVVLTLRRGQEIFKANVVLRDILSPAKGKTEE